MAIEITHPHYEVSLRLSADVVRVWIIENPAEYYRVVCELKRQLDGGEGDFRFTENGTAVGVSAGELVFDLFGFDFNDKKLVSLLYRYLEKQYQAGAWIPCFQQLNGQCAVFFSDLFSDCPFSLEYNEMQPTDLFRVCSVRFQKSYDSLLEKIICYINILTELKRIAFVAFIGLKSALADEELLFLYDHCRKERIALLLIESSKVRPLLPDERAKIITEDLCEILESGEEI